ncbi:MAG: hypothetical protein ACO1RA_21360 [Planctomycetaceae bacterium]
MEYFIVIPILYWLWKQPPAIGEASQLPTDHPAAASLGVGLVLSGVAHVLIPHCYLESLPGILPKTALVASIAGWLQMGLGFSLMQKEVRPVASLLTFVLLVSFLPRTVEQLVGNLSSTSALITTLSVVRVALHLAWISWTVWVFLPSEIWGPETQSAPPTLRMHLRPRRSKIRPRRIGASPTNNHLV